MIYAFSMGQLPKARVASRLAGSLLLSCEHSKPRSLEVMALIRVNLPPLVYQSERYPRF